MGDMSESELKDRAQAAFPDDAPDVGQVWEHYRGGLYSIVCRSLKEDDLTPLITYHSNLKGTNWTRTLENFTEDVEINGRRRPRFLRVAH
jgi:hypothetical protein